MNPTISADGNVLSGIYLKNTGEYFTYYKITQYADGTSMDDSKCDGIIYRKYNSTYWLMASTGPFNIKWFGAVQDGVRSTGAGTDNTPFFQKAVDLLNKIGGGTIYVPTGRPFNIVGTVYINIGGNRSITFDSQLTKTSTSSAVISSATLIKNTPGDMFRINLQECGVSYNAPDQQYQGIGFNSIYFQTKTNNVNFINAFRTRGNFTNLTFEGATWGIFQPNADADNNQNYCDQSNYENIKIVYPRLGGLRLVKSDNSSVKNIYFEGALYPYQNGITIINTCGMIIENVLLNWDSDITTSFVANSNLIRIEGSSSIKMSAFHIERCPFQYFIYIANSQDISVERIYTKFDRRDGIIIVNSQSVDIDGWSSEDNILPGFCDIRINDANVKRVRYANAELTQMTTLVKRSLSIISSFFDAISAKAVYNKYITATDSNITIDSATTIFLPTITANRTLTITNNPLRDLSKPIIIYNLNTNDNFFWSISPALKDADSLDFTRMKNHSVIVANVSNNGNIRMAGEYQVPLKNITDFNSTGVIRNGWIKSTIQNPVNAALSNQFGQGFEMNAGNDSNSRFQFANFGNESFLRRMNSGIWTNWWKILTDVNIATSSGTGLLSTVTDINAKITGATTLYTPLGNIGIVSKVILVCTAATAITAPPSIDIGVTAGDIFLNSSLLGFNAFKKVYIIEVTGACLYVDSGSAIKLIINTAAIGTAMAFTVYLYGTLI